ncbi:MAG: hypothetical protein LC107_04710 [Chitinophagales bacterium]|nr:hypothetical protein [Chitinophagales bacterium]
MHKYTKPTLLKLEQLFKELNYVVRYEKGNFNSSYCIVQNNNVVVVNKFFDTDGRVGILLDILEVILEDDSILSDKSKQFYKNLLKTHLNTL